MVKHRDSPVIPGPDTPSCPALPPHPITWFHFSHQLCSTHTGPFPFTLCQIVSWASAVALQPSSACMIPCLPGRLLPLGRTPFELVFLFVFAGLVLGLRVNMNFYPSCPSLSCVSGFKPGSLLSRYYRSINKPAGSLNWTKSNRHTNISNK